MREEAICRVPNTSHYLAENYENMCWSILIIYIDPLFASRQDFMKVKEKAYRDKVLGV